MSGRGMLSISIPSLTEKMTSVDSDLRTMALMDLHKELLRITTPATLASTSSSSTTRRAVDSGYTEEHTEKELTLQVLKLLVDPIGEVKNQAVACVSTMVRRARPVNVKMIVNELITSVASSDKENEGTEGRREISCLALKAVIVEIPAEGQPTAQAIDSIIRQCYPIITRPNVDPQLASELLQILADIYTRFPHIVASSEPLRKVSIDSLVTILSTGRLSVRKRAIPALGALVNTNPALFDLVKPKVSSGLAAGGESAKVWCAALASLARGLNASKVGSLISEGKVVDLVLQQAEDPEETDLAEGALVALEVLVLRCPSEVTPYVSQISDKALQLVRYDPNFVELDEGEEDDVDMNGDDEDEDDFDDEGYSDDDDVSWKIRRSAAKLLSALISTRSELLADFYRDVAPILVNRINEREESVRLEVLDALESLLKQTSFAKQAELASGGRNKRKRSQGMDEDSNPEESVTTALSSSLPQLLRAILKQLDGKSVPSKEQCFVLLYHITEVLAGGLETEAPRLAASTASALRTIDGATTSSLAIAALSFLSIFFKYHPTRAYAHHLSELVPAVVRCMRDKLQRISFEGFAAASSLAQSIRPEGSSSPVKADFTTPVKQLFDASTEVLADTSVDAEVRERALDTLGHLLVHEGQVLASSYASALPLISARLESDATSSTAVSVIARIAETPDCSGDNFDQWLLSTLPAIVIALRKSRRGTTKNAEVVAISTILARVGGSLSPDLATAIITEIQPILDTPAGLQIAALTLRYQKAVRAALESHISNIYALIKQQSTTPAFVDALVAFFAAYTASDPDDATRIAPKLLENVTGSIKGSGNGIASLATSGTAMYATTARIVGAVAIESMRNVAGILSLYQKLIKKGAGEAETYLALLVMGEVGRLIDLSTDAGLFDKVAAFFSSQSEEIRSAAAFAIGNLAVGSHEHFLPLLVKHIETADSETTRVLLLHALKEVILHSPSAQLEILADSLWAPLVAEEPSANGKSRSTKAKDTSDATATEVGEESVRNVKAACIGKLTTMAPAKFLPQLQALLHSSSSNRAIVAAAVRFTFIDTSSQYDELISPIVVDLLKLMHDDSHIVRRLFLASLNAAIQNKPHLIIDRLTTLQPLLYQETVIRKELQREVQMGPFKIIKDDGVENRKTAYETMYTLLATCFNKIDLPAFTDRVMAALSDVNEVKVLGLMLLLRLGQLSPSSVVPRLDETVEAMKAMMKDLEVKDDTIQQDLERKAEMQRTTLRTVLPLARISTPQQAPAFHAFVATLAPKLDKEFRDYVA